MLKLANKFVLELTSKVNVPAQTFNYDSADIITNNAKQTVEVLIPGVPVRIVIMGGSSPTPFKVDWQDSDAIAALKKIIPFEDA